MPARRPTVPVIVGPTAVGKTALALALGEYWPLTVISADSRQIYRGLDIGTAKPTRGEQARVPHLGIDLVEPGERYSAGRFAASAAEWLAALPPERRPVVVGGTGFYVGALVDGLFREPPLPQEWRERFRQWARDAEGLGRWAARLDPRYSGGGRQRAARTVEIALLTGRPLSWWQQRARGQSVMRPWYVRLTLPRAVLHQRIERRVGRMLAEGMVDEVRRVLAAGTPPDAPGLDAIGYREVVQYLRGELSESQLAPAIARATRQYAKRQETWFRHRLVGYPVLTLDATDPPTLLAKRVVEAWEQRGS